MIPRRSLLVILLLLFWHNVAVVHAKVREYYISAEEIQWNYAPSGRDNLRDLPLAKSPAGKLYASGIGTVYTKAIFRQYRDNTFSSAASHDPAMGFFGPVIRAESGDQIRILFKNMASRPYSLHPHTRDIVVDDNTQKQQQQHRYLPGNAIPPNETYVYIWDVPEDAVTDPTHSVLWAYSSRTDPVRDINSGLIGPIVIYAQGALQRPTAGSPEKAYYLDQEVFILMSIADENLSHYLEKSAQDANFELPAAAGQGQINRTFLESNRMYHINGFIYNNNKDIHLIYGEAVRWYVMSMEVADDDMHTAHWHGGTLLQRGHRVDVVDLTPISFQVLDMMPDNEGQWLFHCHVTQHFDAGMTAFYQIEKLEYSGEEGWSD